MPRFIRPGLLLLGFLSISAQQALAQSAPVAAKAADSLAARAPQLPRPDTVRALHNLFRSRRSTGGWLTGGSAAVTAVAGLGTLADNNGKNCGGYFCPDAVGSAMLIGIGTAPAWVPGFVTLVRFSTKREQAAVAYFETTRTLPKYLQHKLSNRFFNAEYRFSRAAKARNPN